MNKETQTTVNLILQSVATMYDCKREEILGHSRARHLLEARQAAIAALKRRFPRWTSADLGAVLNRDHTTISYHQRKKVTALMELVIVESPYKGTDIQVEIHSKYAKRCLHHCLTRGEAPFASHVLYTLVLDDKKPAERELGMMAGLRWTAVAHVVAVYTDYGISDGMKAGIERAVLQGKKIEYRSIGKNDPYEDIANSY